MPSNVSFCQTNSPKRRTTNLKKTLNEQATWAHEAGSICLHVCVCVFVCECRSTEATLERSSLCCVHCPQESFVLTRLAWGVAPQQFKEGPVSRLKIAGLRMRTGGFPACRYIAPCFSFRSLSSVISKLFLM